MARPRRASRLLSFVSCLALLFGSLVLSPAGAQPAPHAAPFPCLAQSKGTQAGMWRTFPGPRFPVGPQGIAAHAFGAHPGDYSIYVTNGSVIMGSQAFCPWTELYRLPDASTSGEPYSSSTAGIVTLDATTAPGTVYAGIQSTDTTGSVHVVRTTNAFGGEWSPADGGALQAAGGRLRAVRSAPSNPAVVYALVDPAADQAPLELPVGTTQILFRTADGGNRWEARAVLARRPGGLPNGVTLPAFVVGDDIKGIAVGPGSDGDVWLFGAGGLLHSVDAGATYALSVAAPIGVVDITTVPGAGSLVRAYELLGAARMHVSDGGAFVPNAGPPGIAQSAGSSLGIFEHVVSTNAGVHVSLTGMPVGLFGDVSPPDRRAVLDVAAAPLPGNAPGGILIGRTDRAIEVAILHGMHAPDDPPELPPVDLGNSEVTSFDAGDIVPDGDRLVLGPGESRRIRYRLDLPPAPTPLDVYFLIDVSGSMGNAIRGVQVAMNNIVRRLHERGIDVHFGVGEYRAYTDAPAYKRVRDIGPVNESLRYALQNLYASGGGEETQLAALYQSVTGDGQDEDYFSTDQRNPGTRNAFIEEHQNFNFRDGALRVAIHVSDEVFSTGRPHPSYDQVREALSSEAVRQVGIAITPESQQAVHGHPRDGLEKVAYLSGALAPNPVDCDGDGTDDIAADEPLVCEMDRGQADQAVRMGTVVLELLDAIQDIQDIYIRTGRPAIDGETKPSPVVADVDTARLPGIDLKSENLLHFDVTYQCPTADETRQFEVELSAATISRGLARATATVVCRVVVEEDPPPIATVVPVVPVVPPPVRPPDPAPNPNPRPQANPNPQAAPQSQAGLASQEQEQPQMAFAVQNAAPQAEGAAAKAGEDYRMSNYYSRSRRPAAPYPAFVFGAAALSLTFAFAALARRQVRTQHARAVARPYR